VDMLLVLYPWLANLCIGFRGLMWGHVAMWAIGLGLIWLGLKKADKGMLLLPLGFGVIMANIPFSSAVSQIPGEEGFLWQLVHFGLDSELLPIVMLIAMGTLCDFTQVIRRPVWLLLALAAQSGVFLVAAIAVWWGFSLEHAAAIGLIGTADGATAVYIAVRYAKGLLGPIAVTVLFVNAILVPVIQPQVIKWLTSKEERSIKVKPDKPSPGLARGKILFPVVVTLIAGVMMPTSVALVGSLMLGNLLRESGCLAELTGGYLVNFVTFTFGLALGGVMLEERFLTADTCWIVVLGVLVIGFDTGMGVLVLKVVNKFRSTKINPMLGACGIASFPLSGRVVAQLALAEDPTNVMLEQAVGISGAGQIVAVLTGGLVLALLAALAK